MNVRKGFLQCLVFLSVIFSLFLLSSCGNDSSSTTVISGYAVKGPLAHASIKAYVLDPASPDLMGKLAGTWETGAQAGFRLSLNAKNLKEDYYIVVEATPDTLDLTTGKQPVIHKLTTLITKEQITQNTPIFATPYTTLLLTMVQQSPEAHTDPDTFFPLLDVLKSTLINTLGFGMSPDTDPFTVPALVMENSTADFLDVAAYRSGVEAIGALTQLIMNETGRTSSDVLKALAIDALDGQMDGFNQGTAISLLNQIPGYETWLHGLPIAFLAIPNTDKDQDTGTTDPYTVDEVEWLLAHEISLTGVDANVSGLIDGTVSFTPRPLGHDQDKDGIPDLTDDDDDNDGFTDEEDAFPLDPTEYLERIRTVRAIMPTLTMTAMAIRTKTMIFRWMPPSIWIRMRMA